MENQKTSSAASMADFYEKDGLNKAVMNTTHAHFLMSSLINACPKNVAQNQDDKDCQNPDHSFVIVEGQQQYLHPDYDSKRSIQLFHMICQNSATFDDLYDTVTHINGTQPKNAGTVTLRNTGGGGNAHIYSGETLIHIIVMYGHYTVLNLLLEQLHERDQSQSKDALLQDLLAVKNESGLNVRTMMNLDELSEDTLISEPFKQRLLRGAKSVQPTKLITNNQRETRSCKLVNDPFRPDNSQFWVSELHVAAARQDIDKIAFYLKQGMDPNVMSFYGPNQSKPQDYVDAPIHWWVGSPITAQKEKVLELLLKHGGDINSLGMGKRTALQAAICNGGGLSTQFYVPLLIKHGATLTEKDLYELLLFVYQTHMPIDLPLSQLNVKDFSYPVQSQTLEGLIKSHQDILDQKKQDPDGRVDVYELLKQNDVFAGITTPPSKLGGNDKQSAKSPVSEGIVVGASNQSIGEKGVERETTLGEDHTLSTGSLLNDNNPPVDHKDSAQKDTQITDADRKMFALQPFGQWLTTALRELAEAHPVDPKHKTDEAEAVHKAIADIHIIIDQYILNNKQLGNNMTPDTFYNKVLTLIQDDIIKRPEIQHNEGAKAAFLKIAGGLLYWTKLFMTARTRQRYHAFFFESRASYDFTLLHQDVTAHAQRPNYLR